VTNRLAPQMQGLERFGLTFGYRRAKEQEEIFSQGLGSGIAVSPSDPVLGNELKLSRGAKVNVRFWPKADMV